MLLIGILIGIIITVCTVAVWSCFAINREEQYNPPVNYCGEQPLDVLYKENVGTRTELKVLCYSCQSQNNCIARKDIGNMQVCNLYKECIGTEPNPQDVVDDIITRIHKEERNK